MQSAKTKFWGYYEVCSIGAIVTHTHAAEREYNVFVCFFLPCVRFSLVPVRSHRHSHIIAYRIPDGTEVRARAEFDSREARWSSPPAELINMGDPFCYDLDFCSAEFPLAGPISPIHEHIGRGDFRK